MGTTLIKAKVTDQTLEFTLKPMVASGGVNEDVIEFEFDALWDGFDMVAVFYRSKREVFHQKIVDNRCTVPSEVMRAQGVFYVGVMGVKDNVTRTTNVLRYELEHGAITVGVKPPEPTPSIYEQILETVKSTEQIAQSVRDDADAGMFNGAPGPKGEQGPKGDPGSDASVTAENIQSALGYAPVKDVQVAGSSVLDSGVANVPNVICIRDDNSIGVVNPPQNTVWEGVIGIAQNTGKIILAASTPATINARGFQFIGGNTFDYAVKAAMCDGKGAAWTSAEQKAARERMGADKAYELIEKIVLSEDTGSIVRTTTPAGTPYNYSAIQIFIVGKNASGSNGFVKFGSSSTHSIVDGGISGVQENYRTYCKIEIKNQMVDAIANATPGYQGAVARKYEVIPLSIAGWPEGTITNIRIVCDGLIVAGSTIYIYGVRA